MTRGQSIEGSIITVTGGAGLIGSNLVDRLVTEGASKVRVIDNLTRGRLNNLQLAIATGKVDFIDGDIRNRKRLNGVIQGSDYVFHEAVVRVTLGQDKPRLSHDVIATGTFNVLEACVKHNVKRVIVSSSTTVYGEPKRTPIDEDEPRRTVFFYGAAKVYNEYLLSAFHHANELDYICLRPFNVYGPRMDIRTKYQEVIPVWVGMFAKNEPPKIHGSGTEVYDFTYVDDVVEANILALTTRISCESYNVGTGLPTTLSQLAWTIKTIMGSETEPVYVNPEKRIRVTRRLADTRKAEKELGFKAKIGLDEGLRKFIAWRRKELT